MMRSTSIAKSCVLRLVLVAILSSVVAERGSTQSTTAADGPWAGWARCELTAQAEGYTNQQTHTWVLTSTTPTVEGAFRLYPATWTVTGKGSRQRVMGDGRTVVEQWTTAGEPRPAPISVWIRGYDATLRFTSRHAQLRSQAAATGTSTARLTKGNAPDQTTQIGYDVYEWTFPAIEDVPATSTTVSGTSKPRPLNGSIAPGQPPGTSATEACSWRFVRGATVALLPPEPSSSSAAAATATSAPTVKLSAAGSGATIQTVAPPPAPPPTTEGLPTIAPGSRISATALPTTISDPSAVTLLTSTDPAGPAPTGLRVVPTPTSINLSWVCTSGATGYDVFATPTGGTPVKLTQTPLGTQCIQDLSLNLKQDPRLTTSTPTYITSFVHSGLVPLAEFAYVVRALYPSGFTDSPALTARTIPWPAPTGLAPVISGRTAYLKWNGIPGASGYLVFRQSPGEPAFRQVTPAPLPGAPFQEDLPVGTHQYYVQAVSGIASAPVSVVVGAPEAVEMLVYEGGVDFRWYGAADATSFALVRASSAEGPFAPTNPLFANQWARLSPTPVGQYYKILANYQGLVIESEVLKAPQGISNLSASSPRAGWVNLSFTCDPAATGYRIIRDGVKEINSYVQALSGSTLCATSDGDLYYSTTPRLYTYVVKAQYPNPRISSNAVVSISAK